jgi:hypothetical protein
VSAAKVRALVSFTVTVRGAEHFVREGEELPASHPAVKARRELFAPAPRRTRG